MEEGGKTKMNSKYKMELDLCRQKMWEQYMKVIEFTIKKDAKIFIEAMDRHQEILSQEGRDKE